MRKSRLQVEWYGRAPSFRDLAAFALLPSSTLPLRNWLDACRGPTTSISERGQFLFLIQPDERSPLFCGALGPSHDASLPPRESFFSFFICLSRRWGPGIGPTLPLYLTDAWRDLAERQARFVSIEDPVEAMQRLRSDSVEVTAPRWLASRALRKQLGASSLDAFLEGLHPQGRSAALDLIARWIDSLTPFSSGRFGRPSVILDVPRAAGLEAAARQATFLLWLSMQILGDVRPFPGLFFSADDRVPERLSVLFRPFEPSEYRHFLADGSDPGTVHRLDVAVDPSSASQAVVSRAVEGASVVLDLFSQRWARALRNVA